jgi:hypothetical protein
MREVRVTIDPNAVWSLDAFLEDFDVRRSTVRREVKYKRLRVSRRAGKYYLLGRWILEWLEAGEVKSRRSPERNGHCAGVAH